MPNTLTLPWGRETIDLSLPDGWHVAGTMKPAALSGAADPLLATQAIHPNLPFVDFVSSAQQAVERASLRFPGSAEVLVFPHGGSTYPILP